MTTRIVLGRRANGTYGLFVSAPGFDADVASNDQLLLGLNQFTEQLLLAGSTASLPAFVPFVGFANAPYVFLTSTNLTLAIGTSVNNGGQTSNFRTVSGMFARPYPNLGNPGAACRAAVSNAGMTITGGSAVVSYLVYRKRVQ